MWTDGRTDIRDPLKLLYRSTRRSRPKMLWVTTPRRRKRRDFDAVYYMGSTTAVGENPPSPSNSSTEPNVNRFISCSMLRSPIYYPRCINGSYTTTDYSSIKESNKNKNPAVQCNAQWWRYTAQANSASYPQWDGKWVPAKLMWCSAAGE